MAEHTILVAFTVEGLTREDAMRSLKIELPEPDRYVTHVSSWWIAEDDRTDGSDTDSAVFCARGLQHRASQALFEEGLTPEHNIVEER